MAEKRGNGFGKFKIHGIDTQGQAICSFVAIILLFSGFATAVSPFIGYIPFPIIRRFGYV